MTQRTRAPMPMFFRPALATGGVITTEGDYTIHTFTNSGTFTILRTAIDAVNILVVGGGGSGGSRVGGGGGAGGAVYTAQVNLAVGEYAVTVGDGGAAVTSVDSTPAGGNDGENSVFNGVTGVGGGGGGAYASPADGRNGGCGGGAGGYTAGVGGTGSQGHNGSAGIAQCAGGGGGMGAAGAVGGGAIGGVGGIGKEYVAFASVGGSPAGWFCGGGGGSGDSGGGAGGQGGGGAGNTGSQTPATSGTANTGGGGGGARNNYDSGSIVSGAGGSGIVIIKYRSANGPMPPAITSMSPTTDVTAGGTTVVITGINFTGASAVYFGVTSASFTVDSDTQITATAPAHDAGTVQVSVVVGSLVSQDTSADDFIYADFTGYTVADAGDSSFRGDYAEWQTVNGKMAYKIDGQSRYMIYDGYGGWMLTDDGSGLGMPYYYVSSSAETPPTGTWGAFFGTPPDATVSQ